MPNYKILVTMLGMIATLSGVLTFPRSRRRVCNDSYRSDVSLCYPPHIVAIACLYIAATVNDKDTTRWLRDLAVDPREVCGVNLLVAESSLVMLSWNRSAGVHRKSLTSIASLHWMATLPVS